MRVEDAGVSLSALRFVGKLKRVHASLVAVATGKQFGGAPGDKEGRAPPRGDSVARVEMNMLGIAAIAKFQRTKKIMREIALGEIAHLEENQIGSDIGESLRVMQQSDQDQGASVGAGLAQLRFLGKVANRRKISQAKASAQAASQSFAAGMTQLRFLGKLVNAQKKTAQTAAARTLGADNLHLGAGMKQLQFISRLRTEAAKEVPGARLHGGVPTLIHSLRFEENQQVT